MSFYFYHVLFTPWNDDKLTTLTSSVTHRTIFWSFDCIVNFCSNLMSMLSLNCSGKAEWSVVPLILKAADAVGAVKRTNGSSGWGFMVYWNKWITSHHLSLMAWVFSVPLGPFKKILYPFIILPLCSKLIAALHQDQLYILIFLCPEFILHIFSLYFYISLFLCMLLLWIACSGCFSFIHWTVAVLLLLHLDLFLLHLHLSSHCQHFVLLFSHHFLHSCYPILLMLLLNPRPFQEGCYWWHCLLLYPSHLHVGWSFVHCAQPSAHLLCYDLHLYDHFLVFHTISVLSDVIFLALLYILPSAFFSVILVYLYVCWDLPHLYLGVSHQ